MAEFEAALTEMGHPLIGPQRMGKLHYSEMRRLVEGKRVQRDRKEYHREKSQEEYADDYDVDIPSSGPSRATEKGVEELDAEIEAARQGVHPRQLGEDTSIVHQRQKERETGERRSISSH